MSSIISVQSQIGRRWHHYS